MVSIDLEVPGGNGGSPHDWDCNGLAGAKQISTFLGDDYLSFDTGREYAFGANEILVMPADIELFRKNILEGIPHNHETWNQMCDYLHKGYWMNIQY